MPNLNLWILTKIPKIPMEKAKNPTNAVKIEYLHYFGSKSIDLS
jgi:hypothetical protein